ncbi:AG118 [Symbiodinium sp. KB8]|nr:AG118 [Symbiodinium sp. KB8]
MAARRPIGQRQSFFELWERLLPQEVVRPLRQRGGILCTRFFLVDLASAAWSPYEVDKKVPIFRQGDLLYVGQAPQDFESDNHDAMRQGKHLEGALVEYSEVEEEKILMALELPSGQQVIYAAAPDAFDTSVAQAEARDPLLGDGDYQQAGYSLRTAFTRDDGAECNIWSQDVQGAGMKSDLTLPLSSYVEIKKTTHLNGLNGAFKLMKFWLQVALCGAGCALVGLAEGSTAPVVESFLRMSAADMEWRMKEAFDDIMICERAWGALLQSLAQLLADTSDGQCLVQLWKATRETLEPLCQQRDRSRVFESVHLGRGPRLRLAGHAASLEGMGRSVGGLGCRVLRKACWAAFRRGELTITPGRSPWHRGMDEVSLLVWTLCGQP